MNCKISIYSIFNINLGYFLRKLSFLSFLMILERHFTDFMKKNVNIFTVLKNYQQILNTSFVKNI